MIGSYIIIILTGIYPKEIKDMHKNLARRVYIMLLFPIARNWEKRRCPTIKD